VKKIELLNAEDDAMRIKTNIKAGGLQRNHNVTLAGKIAKTRSLKLKTNP
jgi:hypothetical protein